jgi:uncharacterized protein
MTDSQHEPQLDPANLDDDVIALPPIPRRIPNPGHALLFLLIAAVFLILFEFATMVIGGVPTAVHAGVTTVLHPRLQLAAEAATYFATLLTAWLVFPLLWHRSFLDGIRWNWTTARTQAARLIPLGLLLGTMSAAVDYFIQSNKPHPIDDFFLNPGTAWLLTFFGIFVAPAFEEICFRGFLIPAFAIAYDWLSLPHTPAGRAHWQTTNTLTPVSLLFPAILSSLLFAAIHAQQIGFAWNALAVLFSVSLLLSFVRVKTQSVAASTLVHAAYNSFIFLITISATGGYRHLDHITK